MSLNICQDGSLLVAMQESFLFPPRLIELPIEADNHNIRPLEDFNQAMMEETSLGKVENITCKGANDAGIQMWITYPPDFDPKKKWPVYLVLHGGPHNAIPDAFTFRWNAQVFASWGYIVAIHNFHGSSGFGQDFTASIIKNRRDLPYQDTIKAAEYLQKKDWIDSERIAAGGASFGGYLACILQGAEHPFKTLINHAGVFNNFTQNGADYASIDNIAGEYWQDYDQYLETSPHHYAKNFKTPMLILHGEKDYRVPVNHAAEVYHILQKLRIDSRLVVYPDENHWVLNRFNSLHWYEEKRRWLQKYLGQ